MTIDMTPSRGIIFFVTAIGTVIGMMMGLGHPALAQSAVKLEGDSARGAEIAETCATCHGPDGMGYPEGIPRLVGQSSSYLRAQLLSFRHSARLRADQPGDEGIAHLKSTARSFSGMDSFILGLTDQDIADAAAHYAALKCKPSDKPQPVRPAIVSRCEACHKDIGRVSSRNIPTLASQNAVYLSRQLKSFRAAKTIGEIDLMAEGASRYNRIMFTQARWLTDSQIKDIARFFESVPCL